MNLYCKNCDHIVPLSQMDMLLQVNEGKCPNCGSDEGFSSGVTTSCEDCGDEYEIDDPIVRKLFYSMFKKQ